MGKFSKTPYRQLCVKTELSQTISYGSNVAERIGNRSNELNYSKLTNSSTIAFADETKK